jgi:hypothetical protein
LPILAAPFHLDGAPLALNAGPPQLGAHQHLLGASRRHERPTAVAGAS